MTQTTLGTRHRTEGPIKNEQLNDTCNIGHKTQIRRADQEWTIEWHRQHWAQDTEPKGRSRMNNWMTQTTLGTRHKTEGPIKNEQLNDTDNIGHKKQNRRADQEWTIEWHRQHWAHDTEPKGRSRMNNWMTQTTLGTRHRTEGPIKNEQLNDTGNIRHKTQNRRADQEWTIEWHRQHWEQDTEPKGRSRVNNWMTQATLGTRHKTEGPIKNEQLNDTGNIGNKTQNRRADQEWTIEWHRQLWAQDTEPKGRSRVNNWMTQATLRTRHRTEGPIKSEQLNGTGNFGHKTQNRRADQEWTIEWHRQHWAQDTELKDRSRVNNWMTQTTLGTRHRTEGPIKNEQLNDTGNIGHKTQNRRTDQEWTIEWHRQLWAQDTEPKGWARVNNWMTQATLGTRHRTEGPIKSEQLNGTGNFGHKTQNRRADQELTIEWHRQHWAQDTEPKGRSRMNDWMTQATLGTRHRIEGPIKSEQLNNAGNIRNKTQNRRADQEWTIEWRRQH